MRTPTSTPRCTAGWGYSDVVDEVTTLFRSDRKEEAAQIIPDAVVEDSAIVGDVDHVREQIKVWEASGVTTMLVSPPRTIEEIDQLADLIS